MPLVDGGLGNPYPTIEEVMDTARMRVNDMMNSTEGDLLSDDAPASQTYLTAAWKWYQTKCDTSGVQTFIRSATLYGLPARASNDVSYESFITWQGCSDGINQYEGPAFPQDMISPKSIWRRPAVALAADGSQSTNQQPFLLMTQAVDGLPPFLDPNQYEWREDGLYFYGDNFIQDFKFRYSAFRAPLDLTNPQLLVPMMMCEDCLGARVAYEYAHARGAAQAPDMKAWADEAFDETKLRATRIKGRQSIRRQGYSGRLNNNSWNRCYPNIPTN